MYEKIEKFIIYSKISGSILGVKITSDIAIISNEFAMIVKKHSIPYREWEIQGNIITIYFEDIKDADKFILLIPKELSMMRQEVSIKEKKWLGDLTYGDLIKDYKKIGSGLAKGVKMKKKEKK